MQPNPSKIEQALAESGLAVGDCSPWALGQPGREPRKATRPDVLVLYHLCQKGDPRAPGRLRFLLAEVIRSIAWRHFVEQRVQFKDLDDPRRERMIHSAFAASAAWVYDALFGADDAEWPSWIEYGAEGSPVTWVFRRATWQLKSKPPKDPPESLFGDLIEQRAKKLLHDGERPDYVFLGEEPATVSPIEYQRSWDAVQDAEAIVDARIIASRMPHADFYLLAIDLGGDWERAGKTLGYSPARVKELRDRFRRELPDLRRPSDTEARRDRALLGHARRRA